MIVERHYDDETLIGLLGASADAFSDPHLAVCNGCSDTLASYRAIASVLGEDATWDLRDLRHEPVPETIAALRDKSAQMSAADADAAALVARALAQPREQWRSIIENDAAYRSAAVVRVLVVASETAEKQSASHAIDIAHAATLIGESLLMDDRSAGVLQTVGAAYRQFGYASFLGGNYNQTADAVRRSRELFSNCPVADYELARVDIVECLYLGVNEKYADAIRASRRAAVVFEAFGDLERVASARMSEAFALMLQLRYNEALPVLQSIENELGPHVSNATRARVIGNIALCQIELNLIEDGLRNNQIAAAIDEEMGDVTSAAYGRYHVAALLAAKGHPAARKRLREVSREFRRLGMLHMAVCVGLDEAEILLAEGNFAEAEELCSAAADQFEESGLSKTTDGLTALMYLREAARQKKATPQVARQVRSYLQRLPQEPQLLFAPRPDLQF